MIVASGQSAIMIEKLIIIGKLHQISTANCTFYMIWLVQEDGYI